MNAVPWYDLNWFDYLMLVLVGLSVIVSFVRGFVKEAISLVIWAVALLLAFKLAPLLEQHIHRITHWKMASYLIAFVIIFVSIWLVGLLINLAIRSIVARFSLSFADRMIGACFGVVRGLVIVSLMLMFVTLSSYQDAPAVADSKIAPHFHRVVAGLDHYMPPDMQVLTHWARGGHS